MAAKTVVDAAAVNHLANQMDELSHRAQDVLQRYEDCIQHAQSAQILNGGAGWANISTGAQVKEAQLKIQTRFQQVNDQLRSGASTYTTVDDENKGHISGVGSSLRYV
jgi:uncharacterized protein YukE